MAARKEPDARVKVDNGVAMRAATVSSYAPLLPRPCHMGGARGTMGVHALPHGPSMRCTLQRAAPRRLLA
jgi:hypothetical protein